MADIFNEGAFALGDGAIVFDTDAAIKIMLVKSSYVFNNDHTVTDLAAHEVGVSGYTGGFNGAGRKALASKTTTKDNTNDRTVYDAADPSPWTLAAGEIVGGAAVIRENTNDAGSTALFFINLTDTPTNGGTQSITFAVTGVAYLQQ